jgi:cyclase
MVRKRIIPCLDVYQGKTVKGVNFVNFKEIGNPVELGRAYALQGADELVFLDINATNEKRSTFVELVEKVAKGVDIPFIVGGGISTIDDVSRVFDAGAGKVSINSAAVKTPGLINEVAGRYGPQRIIVAIDAKRDGDIWRVVINGGKSDSARELFEWAVEVQDRGAGEILFTSIDHDGTRKGFACKAIKELKTRVKIPVIASGGAGSMQHFADLFETTNAEAALAASLFHSGEVEIAKLKLFLKGKGVSIGL